MFRPVYFLPSEGKDHEAGLFDLKAERASPGRWEHYALVSDGGEARLYINGVRQDSVDRPLLPHEVRDVTLEFVHGILDDVRVHDRALSDTEVAVLSPDMYHPEAPWLAGYEDDMLELIHAGMLLRDEIDHLIESETERREQ